MQYLVEVISQNLLKAFAAIFMAMLGAYLALYVSRRGRRAIACENFRAVIHASFAGLYPIATNWPEHKPSIIEELKVRFPALQAALSEFRPSLQLWNRWRLDRAWRIYRIGKHGREVDQQDYWQYVPHKGVGIVKGKKVEHDNTLTYKEDFRRNVARLLSYAKDA